MIRSYKQVSKLNNSIQGGITCNNLTIDNNLISNQVAYNKGITGLTGLTGYIGYIRNGTTTGPTGYNITGPTGNIGNTKYVDGPTGSTGPTGYTGYSIIGYQGPQGETGYSYQGSTGPQGETAEGYTGPSSNSISYNSISGTYTVTSNTENQSIYLISLTHPYFVQWYVTITSTSSTEVTAIYFGFDKDLELIPLTGNISLSGNGIYSSNIVFQCYYTGNLADSISISYQIGYVQLFNNI
jgi:hypothetical protein